MAVVIIGEVLLVPIIDHGNPAHRHEQYRGEIDAAVSFSLLDTKFLKAHERAHLVMVVDEGPLPVIATVESRDPLLQQRIEPLGAKLLRGVLITATDKLIQRQREFDIEDVGLEKGIGIGEGQRLWIPDAAT